MGAIRHRRMALQLKETRLDQVDQRAPLQEQLLACEMKSFYLH